MWIVPGMISMNTQAQSRRDIVWMHGLNGEKSKKVNLKSYASRFKSTFSNIDQSYAPLSTQNTSYKGVHAIADFLSQEVNKRGNVGDDRTIVIGHSMGGMVAKELDIRQRERRPNTFKAEGIITLGSPLDGAKIANSAASPRFKNWIFGWGAPANRLVHSISYYLGKATIPGGGIVAKRIAKKLTAVGAVITAFASPWQKNGLWKNVLPFSGQTFKDLRTDGYSARTKYKTTPTLKINMWGNIQRPLFETMTKENNLNGTYRSMINYCRSMYNIYRWIPLIGSVGARGAVQAEGFFLHTIHGRYAQLISDGVSYSKRRQNYRTKQTVRTCWRQSRGYASRSCRKWGWFRWLCRTVVRVYSFITCSVNETFATQTVWYDFPSYKDTDGVVSKASATAARSRWKGLDVEAPRTEHSQLAGYNGQADQVLKNVLNGSHPKIRRNRDFDKVFNLTK